MSAMATFFMGWELWQDMTFVLACAIVVVFAIGLVKLWWTNRILRQLEYIDEEKRARLLEIRRCGIEIPRVDQIPFGVRAIRSGVEVEGIWISRPNTPEPSQDASSASLPGQQSGCRTEADAKPLQFSIHSGTDDLQQRHHGMGSSYVTSSCGSESMGVPRDIPFSHGRSESCVVEITSSFISTGMPSPITRSNISAAPNDESTCTCSGRQDSEIAQVGTAQAVRLSPPLNQSPVSYGNAEIYANRQARRANTNFEVLPAGALGSRLELTNDAIHEVQTPRSQFLQSQPERKKLRKGRPASTTH